MAMNAHEMPQPPDDAVMFWDGHPFSNFEPSPITLACPFTGQPREHATVEHYFQACKATALEDHVHVAAQPSPLEAKTAGRAVALRPDWQERKYDVMVTALRAKFALPQFRDALLATGDRPIAEDSPYDFEWGIRDANGGYTGNNLLGKALMEVRAGLRA